VPVMSVPPCTTRGVRSIPFFFVTS
jgi:hypothetical protein